MSLLPYINDMERPFRLMEKEIFRPDFGYSPHQLAMRHFCNPHQFIEPWNDVFRSWDHMLKPMEHFTATMNQLPLQDFGSKITSDNKKFQVCVDVQHFAPEEIAVKVVDKHVIIEGKHEEKEDQHGYVSRQFIRRYALPGGCLPDTVTSKLSSDGILTITAPKVLAMPSIGERIVPITQTGPVKKEPGSPIAVESK